jgi:hypothetical protein
VRCNVDEENFGNIGKFLDDMKANAGHTENVSVYFAPLNNVRMGGNDLAMWQSINAANPLIDAAGFGVSPFLGIGSEVYQAVKMKRRGIGIELKPAYFEAAVENIKRAEMDMNQTTLFDFIGGRA